MRIFFTITISLLLSNLSFSQIDSTKNETAILNSDSVNNRKFISTYNFEFDSIIEEKFYKLSFDNNFSRPKPPVDKFLPIKMIESQTFVLVNGLKVILIQNKKLPFVSYNLYFDYQNVVMNKKKGIELLFKDLWGKNGKTHKENEIIEYKDRTGTKVEVDDKWIYVEGLKRFKAKNLLLLSDLTMRFSFTEKQFNDTKSKIVDSLYLASNKNDYIVDAVARKLMFGDFNPIGENYNILDIESLTYSDLVDYYHTYINVNNGYLVVNGDISKYELKRLVVKYFNKYRKMEVIKGYYPQPYNLPQTEIDFIENYNSDSLSVWVGNVEEKKVVDESWLFNRAGNTILFDEEIGVFPTQFSNDSTISNFSHHFDNFGNYFSISYNVSGKDVAKSLAKSIELMEYVNHEDAFDSVRFDNFKKHLTDNYTTDLYDPHKLSNLYLMYYITGLDKFLIPDLIEVIDTIDYSEITDVLGKSMKPKQLRVVVSGPPQAAVPELEKLGYPIKYYDQFSRITFPPSLDRAVPDSVNVNDVLERYVSVLGGKERLKEVKSLLQWWVMDINNSKLFIKNKYMMPNKRLSTYSNNEVIVLKTVFNGEYGYVEKSGEIIEITGKEFSKLSIERSIFPLLYYHEEGYFLSLESQIPLKGELCYKVRVETSYGDTVMLYFRISDGYLIRNETIDLTTNEVIDYTNYSDFKTFENIVFPYKTETQIGGKKITLTLTQLKINDKYTRKKNFE